MKYNKTENKHDAQAAEPSLDYSSGSYTYADYLKWQFDEMVELIKGKIYKMTPAPSPDHQRIAAQLGGIFYNFFKKHSCEFFPAPFDVRLPLNGETNEDISTVVQPDLCVICDASKIDNAGCVGAPDLVVEILSPSTAKKDTHEKMDVYAEAGVPEVWIISPVEKVVLTYFLNENKEYTAPKPFATDDIIESKAVAGLKVNLSEVFNFEG